MKTSKRILVWILIIALVFSVFACFDVIAVKADDADFIVDTEGTLIKYEGMGGDIKIPDRVKAIGENVFKSNIKIYSVTIPASVKSIANGAFNSCTSLKKVKFNKGLKTIEKSAFYGCSELSNVKLPSTLKSVGVEAFSNCQNIKSIDIPASVTSIDNYAFGFLYNGDYNKISGFSITGSSKGAAKSYAEKYDFPFSNLDGMNVVIKKAKSPKKHVASITWKSEGGATSYQLEYASYDNFSDKMTKTISDGNKNTTTIKGFTSGRTYYFRIRGVKKVNGKKTYSAWSKVQKLKVK